MDMRAFVLAAFLFAAAAAGFAQQNKTILVYGEIPPAESTRAWRIQTGSYTVSRHAESAFALLRKAGLAPVYEKAGSLRRVVLPDVRAKDIPALVDKMRDLGLREIWIRGSYTLNEKWEVSSPDSPYASFEFNPDGNYIVVENAPEKERVHFGEYSMPSRERVELKKLGVVEFQEDTADGVAFSFQDASGNETRMKADKAKIVSATAQTDLFSRTWKALRVDGKDAAGTDKDSAFLFSRAGTYLVTHSDGKTEAAQWKWQDAAEKIFLYSWDAWTTEPGRAEINKLTNSFLEIEDKHNASSAARHEVWEFVPLVK